MLQAPTTACFSAQVECGSTEAAVAPHPAAPPAPCELWCTPEHPAGPGAGARLGAVDGHGLLASGLADSTQAGPPSSPHHHPTPSAPQPPSPPWPRPAPLLPPPLPGARPARSPSPQTDGPGRRRPPGATAPAGARRPRRLRQPQGGLQCARGALQPGAGAAGQRWPAWPVLWHPVAKDAGRAAGRESARAREPASADYRPPRADLAARRSRDRSQLPPHAHARAPGPRLVTAHASPERWTARKRCESQRARKMQAQVANGATGEPCPS
jgi:hypothetical protein